MDKYKSSKKNRKKVDIRLPRPVTRSQKRESNEEDLNVTLPRLLVGLLGPNSTKNVPNERPHLELQRGRQERDGHLPL